MLDLVILEIFSTLKDVVVPQAGSVVSLVSRSREGWL